MGMFTNKNAPTFISMIKVIFKVLAYLIILYFLLGQKLLPDERDIYTSNDLKWQPAWVQVLPDGNRVPVGDKTKVPNAKSGETIRFEAILPDELTTGTSIGIHSIWQDITVYIDGTYRYSYTTQNSRLFGTNSPSRLVMVNLDSSDSGKRITIDTLSSSSYSGTVPKTIIGSQTGIWVDRVNRFGSQALLEISMLLFSIICIILCGLLHFYFKEKFILSYLAWGVFFCAVWLFSESEFRQLIFPNVSLLSTITFIALLAIPFPFLIYMNEMQNSRYSTLYTCGMGYSIVVSIVINVLQFTDTMNYLETLPLNHSAILVAITIIIFSTLMDIKQHRVRDYLLVAIGICAIILAGVLEMASYYIFEDKRAIMLGAFLSPALLFLLFMAVIKTAKDIFTAEREKQKAMLANKAQAQFLANMSHEIRTPINTIIGMNEMILRENASENTTEYAQNIQNSSKMLLGLVNDVLDFTKIESGQLELVEEPYYLAKLLQEEINLLETRAEKKNLKMYLQAPDDLPSQLFGDELRIKQILTNLLTNAVKYTHEGSVTLRVSGTKLETDKILLTFEVIDTGIGIKKESISKLFESFSRLEQKKNRTIEGTGLGLNIAQHLAELMNGSITVESEYGNGSTFRVSIPQTVISPEPIGNLTEAYQKVKQKLLNRKQEFFTAPKASVLVVDDNHMNLVVIKGLLDRTEMQVETASSGKECLNLTAKKKYDIILMDHMMPQMDGVETLQKLRKDTTNLNQHTTVIALTANAIAGSREMYLSYGFDDYLTKPLESWKLEQGIIKYLPDEYVTIIRIEKEESSPMETSNKTQTERPTNTIDRQLGIQYCGNSEKLYERILGTYCRQGREYQKQLKTYIAEKDWENYRVVVHAMKSSSLNIGAQVFSKASLEQEMAAKEGKEDFILETFDAFYDNFDSLLTIVEGQITK